MAIISESERRPQIVQISFGTMFAVRGEAGRIDVITDIREGDIFNSHRLCKDDAGNDALEMLGGTASYELVEKIVGQMSVEQTMAALNRGYGLMGGLNAQLAARFEGQAKKGSRLLVI